MKLSPFLLALVLPVIAAAQQTPVPALATDAVQGAFPAEAARVFAWLRREDPAKIASVTVSGPALANGKVRWDVAWLDAAGKPVRTVKVELAAEQLGAGAEYYREVFRQLAGDDWIPPSAPPDNSLSAFWQGAELTSGFRIEGLAAAARFLSEQPGMARAADAARLAGMLSHSTLPGIRQPVSLDHLLLARAAAWLCVAETRLREPLDAPWGSILFLAGRERSAAELWGKARLRSEKNRGPAERLWQLRLAAAPSSEALFQYAGAAANRTMATPALALAGAADLRATLDVLGAGAADRAHDYFPLNDKTRAAAREAWVRLVADVQPTAGDFAGHREALQKSTTAEKAGALIAVAPAAPKTLIPVATVTVADLLNLGAEREKGAAAAVSALAAAERHPVPAAPKSPEELIAMMREESQRPAVSSDGKPAMPTSQPAIDFTKLKTADEFWTAIEALKKPPKEFPHSPEEQMQTMRARAEELRKAAAMFAERFTTDPRRWDAAMINLELTIQLAGPKAEPPSAQLLARVLAAPDASANAKGEAAFFQILLALQELNVYERLSLPPFHRKLSEFIEKYPEHERAAAIASLQMELLESFETPGADTILKQLAAHKNPAIAEPAKMMAANRERFAEMKREPVKLKFRAADGREVDLAKLRGKVVLLDFWASWCGPCIAEAPGLVALYRDLCERGFEIVGVSLDDDRAKMDAAIKKHGMDWPHHFDGKGWKNDIARQFGVQSIPSTWLFDKKGILRHTGLRGAEMKGAVERLLAEE